MNAQFVIIQRVVKAAKMVSISMQMLVYYAIIPVKHATDLKMMNASLAI